jgi:hypothetical protein
MATGFLLQNSKRLPVHVALGKKAFEYVPLKGLRKAYGLPI